ncbi:YdeI/OmpD-associated family protein [Shinella sp. G-2]|uniref:YdeI/OmpD-associated family protein n=1 Tax=Shinella sp. G-2 TaxID=3133141 RepID=UPI003D02A93F
MAPVEINPAHVREFADPDSFYRWLAENHADTPEVWIKIHKRGSGLQSINPEEAIEVVLCWGWIDGIRKGHDDRSFFQRYSPRGRKSVWSKKNVETVGRLIESGRMTEHGLKQVDAAKADGRWDKAYGSGKDLKIPPDLQAAIDAEPAARDMLGRLTEQNRFALAFRLHNIKTDAARKRKIETYVEMLKRGETIYPQKQK